MSPTSETKRLNLAGRTVEYEVTRSQRSRSSKLRAGPGGIKVICPDTATDHEVMEFVVRNSEWLERQLNRIERMGDPGRIPIEQEGQVLLDGVPTAIVLGPVSPHRYNGVVHKDGNLVISPGENSRRTPAQSLERWMRKRARETIVDHIASMSQVLSVHPHRVYVMEQQTKWGNCSALGNLSFNWRLIMAPRTILEYVVAHEMVHLAVPNHSARFWLTLKSLCPTSQDSRRWLSVNGDQIQIDLECAVASGFRDQGLRGCP